MGIRSKTCGIDKLSKQIGCSKKDSSIFLTPLNLLLKAFILALKDSADAFVLLLDQV
nr:hypothetical protein [Flavobacterium columnare]